MVESKCLIVFRVTESRRKPCLKYTRLYWLIAHIYYTVIKQNTMVVQGYCPWLEYKSPPYAAILIP